MGTAAAEQARGPEFRPQHVREKLPVGAYVLMTTELRRQGQGAGWGSLTKLALLQVQ